ncbi:MAG: hypothetical protein ACHRHE_13580 [Tepidisphaerales bacterium]
MTNTFAIRCPGFLPAAVLFAAVANFALGGVAVSPLKQEIDVKPGEEAKVRITLTNNPRNGPDAPQTVRLNLVDVQVSEEGALDFKDPGILPTSASNWISLKKTEIVLEPRKSEVIECTITPPLSARPGEYYSAVMITMAAEGRTEKGIGVSYRIASGIFVTVLGNTLPRKAAITQCEVVWPKMDLDDAAVRPAPGAEPLQLPKVVACMQNTGQARFDGSGKITLLDANLRTVFTAPLTSRRPCIFAGDSRRFEAIFPKPVPAGKYLLRTELDYQSSWAKARQEMPVEILPVEAELLLSLKKQLQQESPIAEVSPERVTATIPAGATRSLSLTVRNTGEGPIQCAASLVTADTTDPNPWLALRLKPDEFTVSRSGRKSLELRLYAPPDAKPGRYLSTINIEGSRDGLKLRKVEIPVEIEVKTEK